MKAEKQLRKTKTKQLRRFLGRLIKIKNGKDSHY